MNGIKLRVRTPLALAATLCLVACGSTEPVVFPELVITTTSLPDGMQGQPYEEGIGAEGGDEAYSWQVTAGALPPGLALAADDLGEDDAVVSGVPEEAGSYHFTATVTSGDGQTASAELIIHIRPDLPLAIDQPFLPPALVGGPYDVRLPPQGGDGEAYAWAVVDGALPDGLELTEDGRIQGTPTSVGSARFTIELRSGGDVALQTYDLEVVPHRTGEFAITIFPVGEIPASIRPHLDAAVAEWEEAITGNLPPVAIPSDFFGSSFCGGYGDLLNGTSIDDILIAVRIEAIDGPGGVLGRAGPCGIRSDTQLPFAGSVVLDSEDLFRLGDSETIGFIISHEIGHVLGFGTLWQEMELIEGVGGPDPRFVGAEAVEAFAEIGGSDTVPVETQGGEGTRDSHWRQSVFGDERMTGFSASPDTPQPLSIVTLASFLDLGYDVDLSAADSFSLSAALVLGEHADILGHDHVLRGPILELDPLRP